MNAPDRLDSVRERDTTGAKRRVTLERDAKVANAALFVLQREDHTVGHLLRMELLRDPRVRFAGYRHPHPLDTHIELKVQVADSKSHPAAAVEEACRALATEFRLLRVRAQAQVAAHIARQAADDEIS